MALSVPVDSKDGNNPSASTPSEEVDSSSPLGESGAGAAEELTIKLSQIGVNVVTPLPDGDEEANTEEAAVGATSQETNQDADNNAEARLGPSEEELLSVVSKFLLPLRQELKEAAKMAHDEGKNKNSIENETLNDLDAAVVDYFKGLCHFIGFPDFLLMNKAVLRKVQMMMVQQFSIAEGQTDLQDYLEFKPSEIIAFKGVEVFCAFALPEPKKFVEEMKNFEKLIFDNRIAQDLNSRAAYVFIYEVFQGMYQLLMPDQKSKEVLETELCESHRAEKVPSFEDLPAASQAIVEAMSAVFLRIFKLCPIMRLSKIRKAVKKDESNLDLCLYLADHLRMKRREISNREKFPTPEEMHILGNALSIAPENPFVILTLLDTLIGNIRESSGRFFLGPLAFNTLEASMRYLQQKCAELAVKYPKNVMINSIISDYFARYVPLRYYDIEFSLNTLMTAYETNPGIAKTSHRLGIFYRMSLGKLDESLGWFTKAVELNPYHFGATMELFKSLLGKGEKCADALGVMLNKVSSPEFQSWTPFEQADVYFYLGIAYFIKGEYEGTWKWWKEAIAIAETPFTLVDLSETFMNYMDNKSVVSIDQLKLWMQREVQSLSSSNNEGGESVDVEKDKKKALAQRIFQLMIGIGPKPGRKPMQNFPHGSEFPKAYIAYVINLNN